MLLYYKKIIKFCGILSALSILLIMILVSADVFFRYVFNSPILGAMEFSLLLMISIIYLGLGYTEICDRHIAINLIYNTLKPKHQVTILNYLMRMTTRCSPLGGYSTSTKLNLGEQNDYLLGKLAIKKRKVHEQSKLRKIQVANPAKVEAIKKVLKVNI